MFEDSISGGDITGGDVQVSGTQVQPADAPELEAERPAAGVEAGDPVFEATIETFRRNGFPIRKDDETYAVMEFMHLAMRGMEARFQAERRVEMDRMLSLLKEYIEGIQEATVAHRTLMSEQAEAAEPLLSSALYDAVLREARGL